MRAKGIAVPTKGVSEVPQTGVRVPSVSANNHFKNSNISNFLLMSSECLTLVFSACYLTITCGSINLLRYGNVRLRAMKPVYWT